MAVGGVRKFVLDTNCFVDASRMEQQAAALAEVCAWAAPGLYLSTVVAAGLWIGARTIRSRRTLEREVLSPYISRRRLVNPAPAAWEMLGRTLATLVNRD